MNHCFTPLPGTQSRAKGGVAVVEYIIALALLIFVFIVANKELTRATSVRYDRATNPVRNMAPCGKLGTDDGLGNEECL